MGIAMTERPRIQPELIPEHVRIDTFERTLGSYQGFEESLKSNPEKAREFEARVAEIRRRRGK